MQSDEVLNLVSYWKNRALEAERLCDELVRDRDQERYHRQALQRSEEALSAHVERLRSALQRLVDEAAHLAGFSGNTEKSVVRALDETPSQSLREVQAETLESEARLILEAPQKSANGAFDMRVVAKVLRHRAEAVRGGES